MKRILGIIVAILGCVVFISLLVLSMVAKGVAFGTAILVVLISIAVTLVIIGWSRLVLWLLY